MAKLSTCYPLCPLIDRSPIGVTSDSVPGCAIVTLGKNIVIRYKLADQKQASSWSSKDKLSAPVIYDEAGKQYIAVFNQSIVRLWNSTDVDLNKERKLKFEHQIFSILNHSLLSEPVVVFKNGAAISITAALADRKKLWPGSLPSDMTITECFYIKLEGSDFVAIIAGNNKGHSVLDIVEVNGKNTSPSLVNIQRAGKKLIGRTVMRGENIAYLLTLWNDGMLFSLPLKRKGALLQDDVGSAIYTVKDVSMKHVVAMTQMSSDHLAIYGADPSEEGAILAIVNTQFMVVQARQHYKLFSGSTDLWILGNKILLIVGQSLAVVPFFLDTERLCALIGSHKPLPSAQSKANEVEQILKAEHVSWSDEEDKKQKTNGKISVDADVMENSPRRPDMIEEFVSQGYSQAMLCEKLIPSLLEQSNISALLWLLKNTHDFPESALVCILRFCLDPPLNAFSEEVLNEGIQPNRMEVDEEDSSDSPNFLDELSSGQQALLDVIITTPFSDAIFLPYLQSQLNLSHCLLLLHYVARSLRQSSNTQFVQALLRWAGILLDSHYQQFLLSKDKSVASTVLMLREIVESQIESIGDLKMLRALLDSVKGCHMPGAVTNNFYSIETLKLY